jgi:hypothetical protein
MSVKLEHPWAIICEGLADKAFFMGLIQELKLPNFDIPDGKGRDYFSEMLKGLRVGTQPRKLSAILIVSDNDEDPIRSFGEVQEQIRIATGYPVPEKPMKVARAVGQPVVLIMMLPWIDIPGCLETLLNMVWQREREAMKICIDEFLKCTKVVSFRQACVAEKKFAGGEAEGQRPPSPPGCRVAGSG